MKTAAAAMPSDPHGQNFLSLDGRIYSISPQPMSDLPTDKGFFEPTLWSTIIMAKKGEGQKQHAALERLFTRYRRPIILHIRQNQRCNELEAEELAHEFLAHWMAKDFLVNVEREKGRFRTFIKTCIGHFLIDLSRKRKAQINNPEGGIVSIDETNGEGGAIIQPPSPNLDPGDQMDVNWARELLATAMNNLERECVAARRGTLFAALKPTLSSDPNADQYAVIAVKLGTSEGAVKVAFHRLKQRLGVLIREEVKETGGSNEDWEAELRYLVELLGK